MAAIIQRPYRGSRVSTFYPVKTLPPLSSLDSAFQLQEYISLLIRHNVHDVERIVALPGKPANKDKEKEGEESTETSNDEEKESGKAAKGDVPVIDEACWIYEQLRRLAQDLTHPLITMLQQECNRSTCPEMKAGEWLYLCVAHGTDGTMEQCCAIDYILHTLDSATALLNSPRAFPSRLQVPSASHRHFSSLARRLGRIFAHAYFHHRDIFAQAEAESSLYARFLALSSRYDLVPPDFIVIPPSKVVTPGSEGDDGDTSRDATGRSEQKTTIIVPDPSEVQAPRLLAASLDPQGERDKEKGIQRPTSAPGPSTAFNPTSVRVISSRNNKTRNPPGLFVSGSGLIPISAAATAATTTAASLFESAETPISTAPGQNVLSTTLPLAPGQESPRKAGRLRTDTMIPSDGAGDGRGTSPIPVVKLGARLNEPEEPAAGGEQQVLQQPVDMETKTTTEGTTVQGGGLVHLADEPESFVGPENQEAEAAIAGETKTESVDASSADFEPIDETMVTGVAGDNESEARELAAEEGFSQEKDGQCHEEVTVAPIEPPPEEEHGHAEQPPPETTSGSQAEEEDAAGNETTSTTLVPADVPEQESPADITESGTSEVESSPQDVTEAAYEEAGENELVVEASAQPRPEAAGRAAENEVAAPEESVKDEEKREEVTEKDVVDEKVEGSES